MNTRGDRLELAQRLVNRGCLTDAALVLRLTPGLAALRARAALALWAGDCATAAMCGQSLTADHPQPSDWSAFAEALLGTGAPEEALVAAAKGAHLAPRSAEARVTLGRCLLANGEALAALHALDTAWQLQAAPSTQVEQARALLALGRSAEALDACASALAAGQRCAATHAVAVQALLQLDRTQAAIQWLQSHLGGAALDPELGELLCHLLEVAASAEDAAEMKARLQVLPGGPIDAQ
jgi:tetratricopeptide (TPR) repeat protein